MGGGRIWPLERIEEVLGVAREHGAAYPPRRRAADERRWSPRASPPADYASGFDTAWIDFSKGLGAPVGAVLAASRELIEEAWRYKQMMGGALRQSGILAAGCLYALDHHVERLAEDHANARALAEGLAAIAGRLDRPGRGRDEHRDLRGRRTRRRSSVRSPNEVDLLAIGPQRVRAVTHLDVDRAEIDAALSAIAAVAL